MRSRCFDRARIRLVLFSALVCIAATMNACSKGGLHGVISPNALPSVTISQSPARGDTTGTYAYELSWAGFDSDGRVVAFDYIVDPPTQSGADTAWTRTTENRRTFQFRSDSVGAGADAAGLARARRYHTVVVRCIDDRGGISPIEYASFTSTTIAPTVSIQSPKPSALLVRRLAPSLSIRWTGQDLDGTQSQRPITYRWILLRDTPELPLTVIAANPDSLRRRDAPTFEAWNEVSGSTESVVLRDLSPGQDYVFAIVAIDEAGAYSPVFNANTNLLFFTVEVTGDLGPQLTIQTPGFAYQFPSGGVFIESRFVPKVEVAAGTATPITWSAIVPSGGFIRGYRWALDLDQLDDETPRSDEAHDLAHWSQWTTSTAATLPAISPPPGVPTETHIFYLEAEDDVGLVSIVSMWITAVRPIFDRPLLIIDDTALAADMSGANSCVRAPSGAWPTAAELDTFLYARGGAPYKCYPTGTRSRAGIFAGYAFDTIGTHAALPGTIGLGLLDRYQNIIWITDLTSAFTYENNPNSLFRPMPLLRAWTTPPAQNPLTTWIRQGGRLWLMGGGAALASLRAYNKPNSPPDVYASDLDELRPGTLMSDYAHWRSELRVANAFRATRNPGLTTGASTIDYSSLPPELLEKTASSDPLPPLRTSNFYLTSYPAEHLTKPNTILEPQGAGPDAPLASVLDTVYTTFGGSAGTGWPLMTVYRGAEIQPLVFSGFPIWYFRQSDGTALVDFVLQRMWGMQRRP